MTGRSAASSAPDTVRVTIERLVIEADGRVRGDVLAAAFADELGRLASRHVPPGPFDAVGRADQDATGDPLVDPVGAGRALAAAVHAALLGQAGHV